MSTELNKYDSYELLPQSKEDTGTIFPIAFSLTKYDWSNLENESGKTINRLILAVSKRIQEVVKDMIKAKKKNLSQLPADFFITRVKDLVKDDSIPNSVDIKIPLKDFNVAPHYYSALREILEHVYQVGVKFPEKKDNGIEYITYKSLCYCSFPLRGRKDHVIVHFDNDVINALVNLEFGYQRISPQIEIVVTSKDVSSISYRIYNLLNAYDFRHRYDVNLNDFREILGVKKGSYSKLWQFKQKVMDPARKKLKELCDRGVLDLYFDYNCYKNKDNSEDMICLIPIHGDSYDSIHSKELEDKKAVEEATKLTASQERFFKMLKSDFPVLDTGTMKRFSLLVTDENIRIVERMEISLKEYLDSNKTSIKDTKVYLVKSINDIFKNAENELRSSSKANQEERPLQRLGEARRRFENNRRSWISCQQELCAGQSQQDIDNIFSQIKFESFLDNTLTLDVPSREVFDEMELRVARTASIIRKYFGDDVKLGYRILNNN